MTEKLFLIEIELKDCHVKVSREFVVPAGIRLDKLHDVIQDVMGWRSCHLYVFHTSQGEFGFKDPDYDDDMLSDKTIILADIVTPEEPVFYYEYDMGDGWEHILEVKSFDYNKEVPHPIHCLKAKGTCPPEDVGGTSGYENFCKIISNPKHPEYGETVEWLECSPGEKLPWPKYVSIDDINELLHGIKYKPLKCNKRTSKPVKPKSGGKYVPYEDKMVFVEQEILDKIMALPPTKIHAALMEVAKAKIAAGLTIAYEDIFNGKNKLE